jgi:beta-xylosidase
VIGLASLVVAAGVVATVLATGETSPKSSTATSGSSRHPRTAATAPTSAMLPAAADAAAPARIITPGLDLPNPFVLVDHGRYYLYSSQYSFYQPNIPLRTSTDLKQWSPETDALPRLPAWGSRAFTWAPDVRQLERRYVMYFTEWLNHRDPITKCIGVAVARTPSGPFDPIGGPPIVCQLDHNGSIDARSFVDANGDLWLDWKSDDNANVNGTSHSAIYAQRLTPDGLHLIGSAVVILRADQPWEGRIVEAPQMVLVDHHYWLFYSGSWFNEPSYAIGVAECAGPAGPCTKPFSGPWLGSNLQGTGPGEESLFYDRGSWWIVYGPFAVRYRSDTKRPVALARVAFGPHGPYLAAF